MTIIPSALPHGVNLPRHLAEDDALALVDALAGHYGWSYRIYGRGDVEEQLTDNYGALPGGTSRRRLTDEEWTRVRTTRAWTTLAATAGRAVADAGSVGEAIRQAAIECVECDATLTGPPTATWGLCPTCLNTADLADLRRRACPAAGGDLSHTWTTTGCRACGIPVAEPATTPLHLAA
jgi:hypothetical protein